MGFPLGFLLGFVLGGGVVGCKLAVIFFVFFLDLLPILFLFLDIEEIKSVGKEKSSDKGER